MIQKIAESKKAALALLGLVCLTGIAIAFLVKDHVDEAMKVTGYVAALLGVHQVGQSVIDTARAKKPNGPPAK